MKSVLLTEDTDFGELVYADGFGSSGVILFRFPATARRAIAEAALDVVNRIGEELSSRLPWSSLDASEPERVERREESQAP
jgi:hypothetical protein